MRTVGGSEETEGREKEGEVELDDLGSDGAELTPRTSVKIFLLGSPPIPP